MKLEVVDQTTIELPKRRVYLPEPGLFETIRLGDEEDIAGHEDESDDLRVNVMALEGLPGSVSSEYLYTNYLATPEPLWSRHGNPLRGRIVDFLPDTGSAPVESAIDIPVMRLHCPKHTGCTATETYSVSRSNKVNVKVTMVGLNAAVGLVAKLTVEREWDTADGQCLQLVVPAVLRLEIGHTRVDREPVAFGLRATVTAVRDGMNHQQAIPTVDDRCLLGTTQVGADVRLMPPLAVDDGKSALTFRTAFRALAQVGVDLQAFGKSLGISLGFVRELLVEGSRRYVLSSPAVYAPFVDRPGETEDSAAEILWATDESGSSSKGPSRAGRRKKATPSPRPRTRR